MNTLSLILRYVCTGTRIAMEKLQEYSDSDTTDDGKDYCYYFTTSIL